MHQLALTIVLTSQGISFLHAGTEFLRSKKGVENSFNAGDSINAINWFDKADNSDVYQYVRALVQMRKEHPAFRLATQEEISRLIRFDEKHQQALFPILLMDLLSGIVGKKYRLSTMAIQQPGT